MEFYIMVEYKRKAGVPIYIKTTSESDLVEKIIFFLNEKLFALEIVEGNNINLNMSGEDYSSDLLVFLAHVESVVDHKAVKKVPIKGRKIRIKIDKNQCIIEKDKEKKVICRRIIRNTIKILDYAETVFLDKIAEKLMEKKKKLLEGECDEVSMYSKIHKEIQKINSTFNLNNSEILYILKKIKMNIAEEE